jgi:hypothetical protein
MCDFFQGYIYIYFLDFSYQHMVLTLNKLNKKVFFTEFFIRITLFCIYPLSLDILFNLKRLEHFT